MAEAGRQVRLFVGIKISLAAVGTLASTAETLRRRAVDMGLRIRWVAPASYHITLKFLGWTRPEAMVAIRDVLARSLTGPTFDVSIRGLGAFPRVDDARVLWAGVDDPGGGIARLAETVEHELGELGFAREVRPFHPHITLGRMHEPADLTGLLASESAQTFRQTVVDAVVLYESIMKTLGSEYMTRARFPLGAPVPQAKRQTGTIEPMGPEASQRARVAGAEAPVIEQAKMPLPGAETPRSEAPDAGDRSAGNDGKA